MEKDFNEIHSELNDLAYRLERPTTDLDRFQKFARLKVLHLIKYIAEYHESALDKIHCDKCVEPFTGIGYVYFGMKYDSEGFVCKACRDKAISEGESDKDYIVTIKVED